MVVVVVVVVVVVRENNCVTWGYNVYASLAVVKP
jgi:hypothetical protein